MNSKVLGTVAVAGAVATFALLNVNGPVAGSNFLSATAISDGERAFINFISEYHRSYGTKEEYAYRLAIFEENLKTIIEHNSGSSLYEMGITSLTDLSDYEYRQMLGYTPNTDEKIIPTFSLINTSSSSMDWRDHGAVTGIKNQGSCGSCWAFSTTGAIEGIDKIKNGKLTSRSEQQLVDCAPGSCNGGNFNSAFSYCSSHALNTESSYGYTGRDGSCHASSSGVKVKSHTTVAAQNPQSLLNAAAKQPVSVSIEADKSVFQHYTGGIIDSSSCGTRNDHAVLVIGYGSDKGEDYWLLKNSWGTTWGEKGYFRILREMNKSGKGICGILEGPSYPNM